MYASEDDAPPLKIIAYMEKKFTNVRFVDMHAIKDFPPGLSVKGMQIKILAIMYSSFEEVLWLDTDNMV